LYHVITHDDMVALAFFQNQPYIFWQGKNKISVASF